MTAKKYTLTELQQMIANNDLSQFYNSTGWRNLSKYVIHKFNNECYKCKTLKKYAPAEVVHHVRQLKRYPELAYKLTYIDDNHIEQLQLIPLCRECHEREHNRLHEPPPPLTAERW